MGPRSDERGNSSAAVSSNRASRASMGPRSDERGNKPTYCAFGLIATLQWGRAQMSAEITLLRTCRLRPDTASMGPRSDERGNALESADALGKMEQLQWGRAQMSAEISPRS